MIRGMEINIDQDGDVFIVSISGALEAEAAETMRSKVMPLCEQPKAKVLMDCSGLTYINSLAMGQLSSYHMKCLENGGRFAICGVDAKIYEIMKLIHLDDLVTICASRETGLLELE